jgi:hypothetical protein
MEPAPVDHESSPAFAAERVTDTGAVASLQRLALSGEIERGLVTVIGLDAIRERLGAKWQVRRDWVWETVERHLTKGLGASGFWLRLGEVDVAVCAGRTAEASRVIGLNLLRELLDFFLGSSRFEDMRIASIVWVRGDEIGCARLDPRGLEEIQEPRSFQPDPPPARAPIWSALSFRTAKGRNLRLDLAFESVINLRNRVPVATRLKPLVREQGSHEPYAGRWIEELRTADQIAAICAIGGAAKALHQEGDAGVIVPCSLSTLAVARNRAMAVEMLQGVEHRPAKPVVIELIDLDQGTPQGRLLDAVSLLSPHCRAVIARLPAARPALEMLRGARLGGVSVECAGCRLDALIARLSAATHPVAVGPLTFAFGLASEAARDVAAAAGATHGGLVPPRSVRPTVLLPH